MTKFIEIHENNAQDHALRLRLINIAKIKMVKPINNHSAIIMHDEEEISCRETYDHIKVLLTTISVSI